MNNIISDELHNSPAASTRSFSLLAVDFELSSYPKDKNIEKETINEATKQSNVLGQNQAMKQKKKTLVEISSTIYIIYEPILS